MTFDLADFPPASLEPYGIEVQHPDEFLCHQLDLAPDLVRSVVRELRAGLTNPPRCADEYLATLERHALRAFADALRSRIELL